jgi:hypothetical protein
MTGFSAALAAIRPEHRARGLTESLRPLQHHWAGGLVLLALASGLACLAGWLAVAALSRRDHTGPARYVFAAGTLGDAAVYFGFMASVVGIVIGAGPGGGDHELQSWAAWLMAHTYGRVLLGMAGAIVAGCGVGLVGWAAFGDIEGPMALSRAEKRLVRPIGRYGIGGRGAAIALIGGCLIAAAIHGNPREAHELGGLLDALRAHSYGIAAMALFALAFVASSLFDFMIAVFRRFDPADP